MANKQPTRALLARRLLTRALLTRGEAAAGHRPRRSLIVLSKNGSKKVHCRPDARPDARADDRPDDRADPGGDSGDVHPILSFRCVPCHEASTPGIPGHGARNADAAFSAVQGMSMGQPVYLRILARASGEGPGGFMPPSYAGCVDGLGAGTCLSVAEFELIELWVEQGASQR